MLKAEVIGKGVMLESMRSKPRGKQPVFGSTHGSGGIGPKLRKDQPSASVARVTPTGTGFGVRATINGAQLESKKMLHSTARIRLEVMDDCIGLASRQMCKSKAFTQNETIFDIFPEPAVTATRPILV
jgi:hypothetical protein